LTGVIRVGDVGTYIDVDTKMDLTGATVLQLHVRKPDGTSVVWDAVAHPTKSTFLRYTTASGDIDQAGKWELTAYVLTPSWSGWGDRAYLAVHDP